VIFCCVFPLLIMYFSSNLSSHEINVRTKAMMNASGKYLHSRVEYVFP
jgi:hypothetical protein